MVASFLRESIQTSIMETGDRVPMVGTDSLAALTSREGRARPTYLEFILEDGQCSRYHVYVATGRLRSVQQSAVAANVVDDCSNTFVKSR